jgi:hypothetical protein
MNAEQKELFRMALLRVLEANPTRFGLGVAAVGHHMVLFGFPNPPQVSIGAELQYLEDKGLITQVLKGISPNNRAWRITAAGQDFIASQTAD